MKNKAYWEKEKNRAYKRKYLLEDKLQKEKIEAQGSNIKGESIDFYHRYKYYCKVCKQNFKSKLDLSEAICVKCGSSKITEGFR